VAVAGELLSGTGEAPGQSLRVAGAGGASRRDEPNNDMNRGVADRPIRRYSSMFWKLTLAIALVAGLGGVVYFSGVSRAQVKDVLKKSLAAGAAAQGETRASHGQPAASVPDIPEWDGLVTVDKSKQRAFGLHLATVEAQTEPLKLELPGRTAYDPDTLYKVRPRFDTLVLKVYVIRGRQVKKGDPLVELYSTDLASAKSDFQTKFVQWQHDRKLYDLREKLVQTGAISQQTWVDTQNDEQKSRLDYNLALDKLQVYEVPSEEINPLIDRLRDKGREIDATQFGEVSEKAKMTLRAKADGIVIDRQVVPGNFYETGSELMVIAPLDHLWVLANVFELDQDKVKVGQKMEIQFPFLEQKIMGRVQYVANEVSKDTRAVQVRATIPNPKGELKADMLVRAILEIPPQPNQTVIPRLAMIAINGEGFVFVHKSGTSSRGPDKFERRKILVAQERIDQVIVKSGLVPGEQIVTNGSLILAQLFEDQRTVDTGMPMQ
jgi:cobalt-zinc-cadmium efflux system membrane fusion protein